MTSKVKNGSIVLFHNDAEHTPEALPNILKCLKDEGYEFVFIEDLCVDENLRGKHIGKELYEAAVAFAKENGCYNLTLNVWSCNESALRFYEKCGLVPQKIAMEKIL